MCAVITTFISPHHGGAMPDQAPSWASAGSAIWVYSSPVKAGFKTVAIARGTDKELLARKLGAWR
jgi:D-arabinose 1-dehydrogenase-like Zn-dependent alcohol dehydrogenase